MATRVLERLRHGEAGHPADDGFATLTPQEERILGMIGDGLTNREIAGKLSLSEKTVKNYVSQVYSKLHVERRSQAATLARPTSYESFTTVVPVGTRSNWYWPVAMASWIQVKNAIRQHLRAAMTIVATTAR